MWLLGQGRVSPVGGRHCSIAVSQNAALKWQILPMKLCVQPRLSRDRFVPAGRGQRVRRAEQHPRPLQPQAGPSPMGDPAARQACFSPHCVFNQSTKAICLSGLKWLKALVPLKRE